MIFSRIWLPLSALLALAVLLSGCQAPLSSGLITAKNHYEAYTSTSQVPIYTTQCLPQGKTITCHQVLLGFNTVKTNHPERWTVTIRSTSSSSSQTSEIDVDQATYDKAAIGDYYDTATHSLAPQ